MLIELMLSLCICICQEPGQLFNKVPEVPESRVAFSLADFVKKYNLGIPVAGYYFRARHGD
jgi:hypothetical protein